MSQPAQTNLNPTHWRPFVLSLTTHLFLVAFLLLWGFSANRAGPEGELRHAGIVLTQAQENQKVEYLNESDLAQETENKSEIKPIDPSALPPPALAAPMKAPDRPDLPGFAPSDFDANEMADVPAKSENQSQYQLSEEDLKLIRKISD